MRTVKSILEEVVRSKDFNETVNLQGLLALASKHLTSCADKYAYMGIEVNLADLMHILTNLSKVLYYYNLGDIMMAQMQLTNIVQNDEGWSLKEVQLKSKTILYRMRGSKEYSVYDEGNMFHISFSEVENLPNYRFSINGFPCLYLGSSLYACWEEVRRPEIEKVNYTAFKTRENMRMISVDCPTQMKIVDDIIKYFIFVLCTKYVDPGKERKDNEAKFKIEYVIPEMLLQILIRYNHSHPLDRYDGIHYISSRFFHEQEMFKIESIFSNYVIPVTDYHNKGYSEDLKSKFLIGPISAYYQHNIKFNPLRKDSVRINNYSNTFFNCLEQEISKGPFKSIKL